jgi:hypothetical protein
VLFWPQYSLSNVRTNWGAIAVLQLEILLIVEHIFSDVADGQTHDTLCVEAAELMLTITKIIKCAIFDILLKASKR